MKTMTPSSRRALTPTSLSAARANNGRDEACGSRLVLQRILVPVDFSICSKKALQYAAALAQEHQASLVLLHVIEGERLSHGQRRKQATVLTALAKEQVPRAVPVTILVKAGNPLCEITNLARAGAIDLLVVSTHGQTGPPDFCRASAAEQIVRYAPCPVLVVREHEHDFLGERRGCFPAVRHD